MPKIDISKMPPWATGLLVTVLMGVASYFLQGVDKQNKEDHKEFRETEGNIRERVAILETENHILLERLNKKEQ